VDDGITEEGTVHRDSEPGTRQITSHT